MSFYRDDEVNVELTKEIQKDKKYQVYLDWLKKNGALFENIEFPVAFGNSGYIGVAAKERIPPNKVIVAIPNKLLLSTGIVDSSSLMPVLQQNPHLFNIDQNYDADFNKLTLYLMTEKVKADKSFWAPYLNISPTQFTLLDWTDKEVENIGDPYMFKIFKEYRQSMESTWKEFLKVIVNYPNIISTDCCNKKLFYWSYQFVTTRCYGWNFPHTLLVPLADAFNHSKDGNCNLIFNKAFELGKKKLHKNYIVKSKEVDYRIFKQFNYDQEALKQIQNPPDIKKAYISVNTEVRRDKQFLEDLQRQDVENDIRLINAEKLKAKYKNLWEIPYFTTSETEDNDTEESDQDENFENNEEYNLLKARESISVQYNLQENKEEDIQYEKFEEYKEFTSKQHRKQKYKHHLCEENWDWYDLKDDDTYFTVSTPRWQPKGRQIYHCYGRRNNRFLMVWYGFCHENNYYDSFPFRFWSYVKSDQIDQANLDELVYIDYVDDDEYDNGIMWCGQKRSIEELTKEFRLKKSKLCLDFITYLRVYFLTTFKQNSQKPILITVPTQIEFEKKVFELAYKLLWVLKKKVFDRPIEEDEKELQNPQLNYKKRFTTVLKKEHKIIIQTQINIVKLIQRILNEITVNNLLTSAVSKKYDDIEPTEEDYQLNRERIRQYIHQLYFGVFKQKR
ncbi:hypothetical protein ABPG72_006258 [Tetrahymena utriculariae]